MSVFSYHAGKSERGIESHVTTWFRRSSWRGGRLIVRDEGGDSSPLVTNYAESHVTKFTFVCMPVYVRIPWYVCLYMYAWMCMCYCTRKSERDIEIQVGLPLCTCLYMYAFICMLICMYTLACIQALICVCMDVYVPLYVCLYMYVWMCMCYRTRKTEGGPKVEVRMYVCK